MERLREAASRFILICAVGGTGCALPARAPETQPSAPIAPPSTPSVNPRDDELLRYIESVRAMPAPQLEHEAHMLDHNARLEPNAVNRLRLGVFLGFAPPPYRATGRAQELLDGVWRDDGGQRDIVRLLQAVLQDRQQLETTLTDERRQRQALRNKLDQLKAIEEDLDRRMEPPVINPR